MTGIDAVTNMLAETAEAAPLQFTAAEQPEPYAAEAYVAPVYETEEGQYVGTGDGMSVVNVRVTMDGDAISEIEVLDSFETPRIGSLAIEQVPAAIIDAQSTEVDVVAGATRTSQGIIAAVNEALAQA